MSIILEGRNITKKLRDEEILRGISLQISRGDFSAIVGVSGSGKSTLMYILGLLDEPTTGEVLVDGKVIDYRDKKLISRIRNRKLGFVFQFHYLIGELSAFENILVPIIKNGGSIEGAREKCYRILDGLGLKGKEDRKPYQLSGGEQQRVAVARALANDPEIIMADEPTGNLDSKNTRMVVDIFLELNEKGRAILMITHELQMARETKKVFEIEDGLIVN